MKNEKKRIIRITSGIGEGETDLAAFDQALWHASIANYNLIKLSSIIPPNSEIKIESPKRHPKSFGNKLYVVLAEKRETTFGREAWAGIGYVQTKDGKGLFVEHDGGSQAEVMRLIRNSLTSMMRYRSQKFGKINYQVVGTNCTDKPVCALVAAVYEEEGWTIAK